MVLKAVTERVSAQDASQAKKVGSARDIQRIHIQSAEASASRNRNF